MWFILALLSAVFAALTSILAKVGIEGVSSNLATAIRTLVVLAMAWLMVFVTNTQSGITDISRKSWIFLILSGLATGASWLCYFKALQLGDINKVVPIDKSSTVLTILLAFFLLGEPIGLLLLCKQAAKNFHTICKKETALKRVLSNLLSAVSLLRFKAVFSCGFRVPPGSGLYQSCAAGSVCIPAGQKYCSPRPRKSCPADRKTPGLPSRCIGHRW